MKKIEELFASLTDHQLIIDGLKTIEVEAINKYWLGGKLQQPMDVSKNTALTYLSCYYNKLTSLDVSKNTALTYLSCSGNSFDCDALKRKYGIVIENKGF